MAVISFKCPNCDGELIFDPETQKYKCEYCMSFFSQEELDALTPAESTEKVEKEVQYSQENTTEESVEEMVRYTCPSCGAEIVTDATTAATFCYYCHNPVVLGGKLEGEYLPNKIIPFEVTKEEAQKAFLDFVGKKKFVPKAFFSKSQIESITGVYFPFWLYDVELDGELDAEAKNIRVWRSGDIEYTQTKFYAVKRGGDITLRNLTENALKKANVKLTNGIMPYDFSKIKDFHVGYLSGFVAERRDVERVEVQNKMQQEMREDAERLMRETVTGYNAVTVRDTNLYAKKETWSYVLLPVWTITYKGRNGRIYYYSMNGQNRKICGELPVDKPKLATVSAVVGIAALVLGLIGGYLA